MNLTSHFLSPFPRLWPDNLHVILLLSSFHAGGLTADEASPVLNEALDDLYSDLQEAPVATGNAYHYFRDVLTLKSHNSGQK